MNSVMDKSVMAANMKHFTVMDSVMDNSVMANMKHFTVMDSVMDNSVMASMKRHRVISTTKGQNEAPYCNEQCNGQEYDSC